MTDRELLELAAKAAGIDAFVLSEENDGTAGYWNPLTDDGDALRLVVKLNMSIELWSSEGGKIEFNDFNDCILINDCGDSYSATRRAIVHAAAEIGKAMED